ncbi:MAG TPA: hypothetical protein V6D15_20595 [Oculatellaceae cyanobacterium]|jgi:hypothetical protein
MNQTIALLTTLLVISNPLFLNLTNHQSYTANAIEIKDSNKITTTKSRRGQAFKKELVRLIAASKLPGQEKKEFLSSINDPSFPIAIDLNCWGAKEAGSWKKYIQFLEADRKEREPGSSLSSEEKKFISQYFKLIKKYYCPNTK